MDQQRTFGDNEFSNKRRQTRKEKFLSRMDQLIPWARLEMLIETHYPKAGNGRRPYPLTNAPLDHAFHRAIVDASHNPVLVHVLNSLKSLMLQSVHASVANLNHSESFKQRIDKHHRQIYHATTSRQAKWARQAAMAHVRYVSDALRQIEEQEKSIIRKAVEAADSAPV